jgi:hypothetical protein
LVTGANIVNHHRSRAALPRHAAILISPPSPISLMVSNKAGSANKDDGAYA